MCLIVDANLAARVFSPQEDADFQPVRDALLNPHGLKARLVYGGKLLHECRRVQDALLALAQLQAVNRATFIDDETVNTEQERVTALGVCVSDDPHVLALARVSGVRLLCTRDNALISDFTNGEIISSSRGKVYNRAAHKPLLAKFCKPK